MILGLQPCILASLTGNLFFAALAYDGMNVQTVIETVKTIQDSPAHQDELLIKELGQMVLQSTDADFRSELASSNELRERIEVYLIDGIEWLDDPVRIRTFRGVLLLLRNLNSESTDYSYDIVLQSLKGFSQKVDHQDVFYPKTLQVYYQVLANMSQTKQTDVDPNDIAIALKVAHMVDEAKYPFMIALNNLSKNSNFLYSLLKSECSEDIVLVLSRNFRDIDLAEDLLPYDLQLISCISNIITHESFDKWLASTSEENFVEVVKSARVIITSSETWDNYQLIAMLTWILHSYQRLTKASMSLLLDPSVSQADIDKLNAKLVIILDILTDLSKFNQVKEFLLSYNAIEDFVYLLVLIHENIKPLNMTKQKVKGGKSFPSVKSYLIEMIAYLCHESFEIQEKVRNLGALAVILSSCIIDDDNPFIKERAIVCLKFLLDKNPDNQGFVAALEAKKTIDDDVLKDVGYEVEVVDGKVQLKKGPDGSLQ